MAGERAIRWRHSLFGFVHERLIDFRSETSRTSGRNHVNRAGRSSAPQLSSPLYGVGSGYRRFFRARREGRDRGEFHAVAHRILIPALTLDLDFGWETGPFSWLLAQLLVALAAKTTFRSETPPRIRVPRRQ